MLLKDWDNSSEFHPTFKWDMSISGLVVEYIVAIDVTRVRFPADALFQCRSSRGQKLCAKRFFAMQPPIRKMEGCEVGGK
jgi:hypothetical protein